MSTIAPGAVRIGYVMKVYPRFSETFIVNEILAHESAGLQVDLFSLRPPQDSHFQGAISMVRAGVTYLPDGALKAEAFWEMLRDAAALPGAEAGMVAARTASAADTHAALRLAHIVRQRGIAHLHAHFASSATTVARIAAAFADITYSFTAHAKDIFHESVCQADLERKLAGAATTITVSDYNLRYLRSRFGHSTRVRHVNNGLELGRFPFIPPADRPRRVVAVGRLVEKKGFATLIDACALLKSRGVIFDCEILGGGELEATLESHIERLGLQRCVSLRGPQPQDRVIQALSNAAVLAMPCVVGSDGNRDGLPTVLLEAMAIGTPCISTDVTGVPEVVAHDRTGLVVRQHDAAGLASAIERLLDDRALRLRLASAARREIEARFDSRRTAGELRAIFRMCVESRQRVSVGA
jgi:colanic acid/amylovoran biosynthesis glycosyltransferase